MLHFPRTLFVALCVALCALPVGARDLPRNDPERKALLDAARQEPGERFIVKDLFRAGDFAYLCALKTTEGGGIIGTDDSIDVYQWIFLREQDHWLPLELGGGLAASTREVNCEITIEDTETLAGQTFEETRLPDSEDDLRYIYAGHLRTDLLDSLAFGRIDPEKTSLLKKLQGHGGSSDFSIDSRKAPLDDTQIGVSLDRCNKNAKCLAAQRIAATTLKKDAADVGISTLLWENCKIYIRSFDLTRIAQCIAQNRSRPTCRPGMQFLKDANNIEHCLGDLATQCRQIFPDTQDQALYCIR
jgi:hypothetical protein